MPRSKDREYEPHIIEQCCQCGELFNVRPSECDGFCSSCKDAREQGLLTQVRESIRNDNMKRARKLLLFIK